MASIKDLWNYVRSKSIHDNITLKPDYDLLERVVHDPDTMTVCSTVNILSKESQDPIVRKWSKQIKKDLKC